jgi:hypothetical protein
MLIPTGSINKENVLYTIIQYIELIKNKINSEHLEILYNEQMVLDAFEFKYCTKNDPSERTIGYVKLVNSYDFDLHDMLIMPYAKENFIPHVKSNLLDVINEMIIEKSVVVIISNSYDGKTNLVDEDYGTNYNILNVHPNLKNANINVSLLDLPNVNRFMSISEDSVTLNEDIPIKVKSNSIEVQKYRSVYLMCNCKIPSSTSVRLSSNCINSVSRSTRLLSNCASLLAFAILFLR